MVPWDLYHAAGDLTVLGKAPPHSKPFASQSECQSDAYTPAAVIPKSDASEKFSSGTVTARKLAHLHSPSQIAGDILQTDLLVSSVVVTSAAVKWTRARMTKACSWWDAYSSHEVFVNVQEVADLRDAEDAQVMWISPEQLLPKQNHEQLVWAAQPPLGMVSAMRRERSATAIQVPLDGAAAHQRCLAVRPRH